MAMKLEDRVEEIRLLIWKAFDKRLQRLGLMDSRQYDQDRVLPENLDERKRLDDILENLVAEMGDYIHAREKLIDELCFTFFNRVAGVKVMDPHRLDIRGNASVGIDTVLDVNVILEGEGEMTFERSKRKVKKGDLDHPSSISE